MRITRLAGVVAAVAVATGACAGSNNTPSGSGGGGGSITVGSANFPESQIIASMYAKVLRDGGFHVDEKSNIGSREVYLKALQDGEITLVPDYIGTLTEYLNTQANGPDAATTHPLATGESEQTFAILKTLLDKVGGLEVTSYARNAVDQNSFAVTRQTAERYGLSTMSDLARPEVKGKLVLGAGADCERRTFCLEGLRRVYGAVFKEQGGAYKKFDNPGDAQTLEALQDGTIDIGLVFTSDGSVDDAGLVRLEDDKRLQPSDNICALVAKGALDDKALGLIDRINQTLTTDDLKALNRKFNVDKEDADDIAAEYLKDKGLL